MKGVLQYLSIVGATLLNSKISFSSCLFDEGLQPFLTRGYPRKVLIQLHGSRLMLKMGFFRSGQTSSLSQIFNCWAHGKGRLIYFFDFLMPGKCRRCQISILSQISNCSTCGKSLLIWSAFAINNTFNYHWAPATCGIKFNQWVVNECTFHLLSSFFWPFIESNKINGWHYRKSWSRQSLTI